MNSAEKIEGVIEEVSKVILGKRDCIARVMCAILAGGHVMIEDIPGVGKTTMALAFAKAMGLDYNRVQFTPDIMPSDITGFTMYRREIGAFEYQQGAVMCNMFLADEINRTSPKTQSALLEVMEENAVTVDSVTREVPVPFIVIATENPAGYTGVQLLPESQLDRFSICVAMGYPDADSEVKILREQAAFRPIDFVESVITKGELLSMIDEVKQITVRDEIYQYIVALAAETRKHPGIAQGLSTRGALAVASLARAAGYMSGRNFVIPDDVLYIFDNAVRHRLVMSSEAKMNHQTIEQIIEDVLKRVEKPVPERMRFHG